MTEEPTVVQLGDDTEVKPNLTGSRADGSATSSTSAATPELQAAANFRNYESSSFQDRVERTYFNMQTEQHVDDCRAKIAQYGKLDTIKMSLMDMFQKLDTIVDESDPDNDEPQIFHAYQTAEAVLTRYFADRDPTRLKDDIPIEQFFGMDEWEALPQHAKELYEGKTLKTLYPHIEDWSWFPLAGFIHDLGKVLAHEDFGALPQWFVVGDTFALGCGFDSTNVFAAKQWYTEHNPDASRDEYSSPCGMYEPHCGLDNVLISYGHDEYFAQVLEGHLRDLEALTQEGLPTPPKRVPKEAIYLIRFHSLYPWHTSRGATRGYTHLVSEYDWQMLPMLKALQKADLYSKSPKLPPVDELLALYSGMVDDHFGPTVRW